MPIHAILNDLAKNWGRKEANPEENTAANQAGANLNQVENHICQSDFWYNWYQHKKKMTSYNTMQKPCLDQMVAKNNIPPPATLSSASRSWDVMQWELYTRRFTYPISVITTRVLPKTGFKFVCCNAQPCTIVMACQFLGGKRCRFVCAVGIYTDNTKKGHVPLFHLPCVPSYSS